MGCNIKNIVSAKIYKIYNHYCIKKKLFMTILQDFYDSSHDNIESGVIKTLHFLCQLKNWHSKLTYYDCCIWIVIECTKYLS